ncbi:putative lipid II flippase FtsW [Candidatus Babeliales bacterium]|nr:putative lipid II flippase FtsW [Candidatus Babeliales bacterium]
MQKETLKHDTRMVLAVASVLTLLGLVFIYSSSSVYALEKFGSAHYFLKKQAVYLIPAFIGFLAFALVPIAFFKRYAPFLFLLAIGLTALTLVPGLGMRVHGSHRWLKIMGVSVQTSEILKLFFVLYLGFFIERKQEYLKSFLHSYLPFLVVLGATFVILLRQPDFGAAVALLVTAFTLLFVANFRMAYLVTTLLSAIPICIALIFSRTYRLNRVLIFLNPWADPQGRGFQIIQSLIAIGSGQLWGLGISNSKQKFFYLPMQHTDFIFPIIAEETGFVGSVILISLYVFLLYFGMRVVRRLTSPFASFTVLGFLVLISVQTAFNLMVTTGLLPTKGLGLPFVSYGGTALVCLWCMMGLMVNFVRSEAKISTQG